MNKPTTSRSSSRAPSPRDSDLSTQTQQNAAQIAPNDISNKQHPATTDPLKRDPPHARRSSIVSRTNLSTSGPLSGFQSIHSSRSPSTATSPRSSRDPSPAGYAFRHASAGNAMTTNSNRNSGARKNSTEVSPHRSQAASSSNPSAAAIHRALAKATPQLQPNTISDSNSRIPRQKNTETGAGKEGPAWPISPRLKSPPSVSPRRNTMRSIRNSENEHVSDVLSRTLSPARIGDDLNKQAEHHTAPGKASALRSLNGSGLTLETVQETSSVPATPAVDNSRESSQERRNEYFSFSASDHENERPLTARQDSSESLSQLTPKASVTNNENSRKKDKAKVSSSLESNGSIDTSEKIKQRKSSTKLELRSGTETAWKNMTVETEIVASIPQATLGPPADRSSSGRNEPGGTLRVKASTETIRPRKERKKATKKAPSINAASSSTRAEIFEDRVKNAMDEATSDDSDETFVYESNPPEPAPKRSRIHSRTPSGTSLSSMHDRSVMRSITNNGDQQRAVPKTRSMKFTSNASNYGTADEDIDSRDGTIRASQRNGTASALQQHFRRERQVVGSQAGADDEVNSVPLSKTKSLTAVGGRGSYAARLAAQNLRHTSMMKRNDGYTAVDLEAEAADDERTPLMGTVRTSNRGNRSMRGPRYSRYIDPRVVRRDRGSNILARFAGCFLIMITISILSFGVVCFLFAMSKPLTKMSVLELKSVIASEQELMLDVVVEALNPNLVPITLMDLDINLFARSKYVGSERWWIEHGMPRPNPVENKPGSAAISRYRDRAIIWSRKLVRTAEGVSNIGISDPPAKKPDNSTSGQTLLLGNITHFDNPLTFDGSFWRRQLQWSTGSIRLSKPGNNTEAGGTERWEHVLKHDFDLIIRGVVRYNIPLGGRIIAVPINGEVSVPGNGSKDKDGEHDDEGDVPSGGEDQWLVKH